MILVLLLLCLQENVDQVEPDGATALPLARAKQKSAKPASEKASPPSSRPNTSSIEFGTFKSISKLLTAEVSRDPIMLANAVFSRGIITQDDLHQLRVMSGSSQVSKLMKLIEDTILNYPFKFDAFVEALRSISCHVKLADKIYKIHRFNLVSHKMKKVSSEEVDLNYLSAELNNSQLISDQTRFNAARSANFTDMCSVLISELQGKGLADYFLNLLASYPNTKTISTMLRRSFGGDSESDSGVTSMSSSDSQKNLEVLAKGQVSKKPKGSPKIAETNFSTRDSPTMEAADFVTSKGGRTRSTTAKPSEGFAQEVRSGDSSDAYHSAEGNSREFPMQRLDAIPFLPPPATSEITVKRKSELTSMTKKSATEAKVSCTLL